MAAEKIVLDPDEVAVDRTELSVHPGPGAGPITVRSDGPDWGDHEIAAYMSEGQYGEIPVDFRVPNRKVTIPLQIHTAAGVSFDTARLQLQAKVALLQREGGWLMRELYNGTKVYLDVVNATFGPGGGTFQSRGEFDVDIELVLETLPDWYGDEEDGLTDDFSTNTAADYSGAVGTPVVTAGKLQPTPVASAIRIWHTARRYYDARVTVEGITPTPTASYIAAPALKVLDSNNMLWASNAGTNLVLYKYDAGSNTLLGSAAIAAATAGVTYWCRLLIQGDLVTAEWWTAAPTEIGTPAATVSWTLTGADATKFGQGVQGYAGPVGWSDPSQVQVNSWSVEPNVYVEKTAAELVRVIYGVGGDYPARCRIVVNELDADTQLGLFWGVRSRHYDSAAALAYEAEALTPLDTAATQALTGASGSTVRHNNLGTNWTPVLSTQAVGGGAHMTHTGTYRVRVRVYSTSTTPPEVRFVWDVGDLTLPVENAPWELPDDSQFYIADLGEVRLDPPPAGTHRWQGQIQAKGAAGGENVYIDRVWLVPCDEGLGVLRAPLNASVGLSTSVARDEFNQSAGALAGKTLPVGGTWSGTGDAADWAVETTGKTAQRTAVSDAAFPGGGRFGRAGTGVLAATVVQADFKWSVADASCGQGLLARYTDVNNFLLAYVTQSGTAELDEYPASVKKVVGGVETDLKLPMEHEGVTPGQWVTLRLLADVRGWWTVWFGPQGSTLQEIGTGIDSALATGGALDDGGYGIYDHRGDSGALTRNVDNFSAWVPTLDAVLHSSQSAELRTDGMFREDSTGAAYGPVSHVTGDLPRLPPAGLEGRPCEVLVKPSRGDLDRLPDSGIDDLSVRAYYRPSWLFAPGA